ncbi:MAG TPA: peptidyl-prolyl cis-trans isomerase [Blastocatellia bacterium]|nr:peptidyl-prolyl cis-trans isomerase [Blastocatellia bacterium]
MLRFFAKFQRSRNLVLLAFSLVLLVGLVIFYIPNGRLDPSQTLHAASSDDDTVIAKVGSQEITLKQYRLQLLQMAQSFGRGNSIPIGMLKQFGADKMVLDQLISSHLTLDQASKLGLTGTDREVSDQIKNMFTDENGKWIGSEEYQRRLRYQGVDVGEFEQDQRDAISSRKFRDYFSSSADQVSDREIEDRYKKDNTKVELVYATVDVDKIRQKFKPTEEELKAFYESHKADFKTTEPTRQVEYIFIASDDVAKIVPVTDEELRKEYENRKQYEYRASVIQLKVLAPQDSATVKSKIDELALKVRGTESAKPEDFATVAKGNSQHPSAAQGGDLGWIKKEPNKKNDFRQRIYTSSLQLNDIEGPFLEGGSWYLLKVTEQREVPFEQMRDTMKATVSNNKAYTKTSELANLAYEKATEYKSLRKAAEEIAKQLNISADTMLKSTPYFKKGDSLKLGNSTDSSNVPAFEDAVATLKKGEIGDKVGIPGGQAVPQLTDLIENGQQLTFDQAHNQVENKLRSEKEPTLAQAKAQEIVNKAKNVEEFKQLVKAADLEVKTDTNFNSYSFSGPGGSLAGNQARTALTNLKEDEVFKTPIKNGLSYLIFAATKRTEADLSKLPAQRDILRQSITSERKMAAFEAFVKSTRKLYEQQGRIKIYQDRIDKFFASASAQQ